MIPVPTVNQYKTYKDYRPISQLYHLGKVTETVIKSKLTSVIPDEINTQQCAYTQHLGTTDALNDIITDITTNLDDNTGRGIVIISIDVSKAFNRMQLDNLAQRLMTLNIPSNFAKLVCNICLIVNSMTAFRMLPQITSQAPSGCYNELF